MTPALWNNTLHPSVPAAVAGVAVAVEVKALLDKFTGSHISTTDLVNELYPPEHARGDDGQAARQRLFDCLKWLAKRDLATYCTPSEPVARKAYGKVRLVRPLLWHAPNMPRALKCPSCGAEVPL